MSVWVVNILRLPAEFDFVGEIGAAYLPGVAPSEPVVRLFDLPSISNFLFEYAEFISDSISDGRNSQSCHRFQITGGKTTESTVSEPRLDLLPEYDLQVLSQRCERFADRPFQIQVDQVVFQVRTEEELGGQIANDLELFLGRGQFIKGPEPMIEHLFANRIGRCHIPVVWRGKRDRFDLSVVEVFEDGLLQVGGFLSGRNNVMVVAAVFRCLCHDCSLSDLFGWGEGSYAMLKSFKKRPAGPREAAPFQS